MKEACENDESGESGAEWDQAVQGASGSGAEYCRSWAKVHISFFYNTGKGTE
jgi:hypothetical protein